MAAGPLNDSLCDVTWVRHQSQRLSAWMSILLILLVMCGCGKNQTIQTGKVHATIGGKDFLLEVAADPQSRFRGLSGRTAIDENGGMVFVFPHTGIYAFVMRDCLVAIDMLCVDGSGRIVAAHAMAVEDSSTKEADLKRYQGDYGYDYVIEVAGGTIGKLGLHAGQRVEMPLDELKRQAR